MALLHISGLALCFPGRVRNRKSYCLKGELRNWPQLPFFSAKEGLLWCSMFLGMLPLETRGWPRFGSVTVWAWNGSSSSGGSSGTGLSFITVQSQQQVTVEFPVLVNGCGSSGSLLSFSWKNQGFPKGGFCEGGKSQ